MTSGPNVRLGTNWPSMTSHWMRSTPAFSRAAHLLAEPGEVGRQHGRGDLDGRGPGLMAPATVLATAVRRAAMPLARAGARPAIAAGGEAVARDDRRAVSCSSRARCRASGCAVELTERAAGRLRPRPRWSRSLEPSAGPGRAAVPVRGRGLRRVRLAARRRPTAQPALKRGARGRRAAPHRAASTTRRSSARAARCRPSGFRTTVRGAVVGGRFALPPPHEPRRRCAVDACLVAHPLVAELIPTAASPRPREVDAAGRRAAPASGCVVVDPTRRRASRVPDGVPVVGADELRGGRGPGIHEEVAGRRWRISAASFFQTRPDGAEAWSTRSARAAAESRPMAGPPGRPVRGVGLFAGSLLGRGDGRPVGRRSSGTGSAVRRRPPQPRRRPAPRGRRRRRALAPRPRRRGGRRPGPRRPRAPGVGRGGGHRRAGAACW